jgi:hypothetical protein
MMPATGFAGRAAGLVGPAGFAGATMGLGAPAAALAGPESDGWRGERKVAE